MVAQSGQATPRIQLVIEDDEGKRMAIPLTRDEITIGRKDGNIIRLTERNVSRFHARLLKQNAIFYIEDLNSYTGIRINGDRIAGRNQIQEGDLIEIGDYHLTLQREGQQALEGEATTREALSGTTEETVKMQIEPLPEQTIRAPAPPVASETVAPAAPSEAAARAEPTALIRPDQMEGAHENALGDIPEHERAHLVAVSTALVGQSYPLKKRESVIGRTDENDVVLDHRSVSRNHAKIVYDGQKYTVVDLKSANGVLVNGEEYSQTALRPGDIVELGHVQLRFIEPGGRFELSAEDVERIKAEAQQAEVAAESKGPATVTTARFDRGPLDQELAKRTKLIAIAAAALLFLLGIVVIAMVFGGGDDKPTTTPGDTPPVDGVPVVVDLPVDTPPDPVETSLTDAQVAELLTQVDGHLQAGRFDEADQTVGKVLKARPDDEAAQDLLEKVVTERRAKEDFAAAEADENAGRLEEALAKFSSVPAGTLYRERAVKHASGVRGKLVAEHYEKANRAFSEDDFEGAKAEIEAGLVLVSNDRKLLDLQQRVVALEERLAAAGDPDDGKTGKTPKKPKKPKKPPSTKPETNPEDAKNFYSAGNKQILQGRFKEAVDQFKLALKADPGFADAHRGLGIAYARLGKADLAVKHYETYVQKRPYASDADKVREILKKFKQNAPK
ncbi:MAG: FHA domain-containing protein [Pseudomonadota bacterium]